MVPISIGIPQGSILEPLLFTIYVNDIQNSTTFFRFVKYADDTTLFHPLTNVNAQNIMMINNELDKVYTWLCVNRLSLNIEKTKFIIFNNKGKIIDDNLLQVKLLQLPIERVKTFNFLGVTLDQNLTWRNHIDNICSKVPDILDFLLN